jgi:glycosyltransferase involved in cell wall biosynthesis
MRIAQIATLTTPVRPDHAGSVEQLVWLLSRELVRMGHEVTVFGCRGASVDCEFIETLPGSYGENGSPDDWNLCEWINLASAVAHADRFDVMHSHVYTWGLPLSRACRCPMLHTTHILPYDDDAAIWRLNPQAHVTALSNYQWSAFPDLQPMAIVPHGIDPDQFTFRAKPDDYLLYLGRFIENKGPLEAIRIAKQLGMRLILAGPSSEHFEQAVKPLIDGRQIQYAGSVDSAQRNALLGGAIALLYPLREPEPFGLVQIEAMMCGTPVVGPRLGAIPEIVDPGITGELADDVSGLAQTVSRAQRLDRNTIHATASARFSIRRMAEQYLSLYERTSNHRRF